MKSARRKTLLLTVGWLCLLLFGGLYSSAQLSARFTNTTASGCAPILVSFQDESTGSPTSWRWDLGNGTISQLQHPSVTYLNPGQYTVKLVVSNAAGADSVIKTALITVYTAPIVDFSATTVVGCGQVNTSFTAQPAPGVNQWKWDFGDGTFSTEQSPTYTYRRTGSYNVSVRLTNSNGCAATLVKQRYITVNNVKANFTTNVIGRCNSQQVTFTTAATGNGTLRYKWYFGNGDSSALANPVYRYPAGGNFSILQVVNNEFGCVDSMRKNLFVFTEANATFSAASTNFCDAPATVHFTNVHVAGNVYAWDFGDSTTSTASNPTHVYTDTGRFTVKLVIKNIIGCPDSMVRRAYVQIKRPFATITNLPDSGCTGFEKTFDAEVIAGSGNYQYQWNFGDGATSALPAPAHRYYTDGYKTVTLIVTDRMGCTDTVVVPMGIRVGTKPVANFSASSLNTCAGARTTFNDLSTGTVTQWEWNFGDNTQGTDRNPEHVFSDTGWLSPSLVVFNGGCSDTLRRNRYIYTRPAVAKFTIDFACNNPFRFGCTNFSIGATSLKWDFGDGTQSTEANPVHSYRDTGIYDLALTAYNQFNGCTYYKSKQVKVVNLDKRFYASDTVVCRGGSVTFTSVVSPPAASRYIWDFGDGVQSAGPENAATHTYTQPGTYSVRLVMINQINCRDTIVKANYVRVTAPRASFSVPAPAVCANNTIVFRDSSQALSSAPIARWSWNFGDGTSNEFTAPPFEHVYTTRGNFRVRLRVTDSLGCSDSALLSTPLTVMKINPNIWTLDTLLCLGQTAAMSSSNLDPTASYRWFLGDGTTATGYTLRHTYAQPGSYTVKLVSLNRIGCTDSITATNLINVIEPVPAFTMSDSFRYCPPLIVQFNNLSQNAVETNWDFGDGTSTNMINPSHFYSTPGIFTVTLSIKGRAGCVRRISKQVVVKGPKGSFSYATRQLCQPGPVTFVATTTDAVSFIWDYSDGVTQLSPDSVITHTYANPGKYLPRIILSDREGCHVPVSGKDTINVVSLQAGLNFPDETVCAQSAVTFSNNTRSSEPVATAVWFFGDGNTSFGDGVQQHQYRSSGSYYPALRITTISGCSDSVRSSIPVRILPVPAVALQMGGDGCVPLTGTFSALQTGDVAVTGWRWDFGNNVTSTLQQPPAQVYSTAGQYRIQLTGIAANGCMAMQQRTIHAWPLPLLTISGADTICRGSSAVFTAAGAATYLWQSDVPGNCTACETFRVQPALSSTYYLTGTNAQGCTATASKHLYVVQPFTLTASNQQLCKGAATALAAIGGANYQWTSNAGSTRLQGQMPLVQPDTTTTYRVIATDQLGCFIDTAYAKVTVQALPSVNAGEDKQVAMGVPVDLMPVISPDVTSVRWTPTDAIFRNNANDVTVRPDASTEYTVKVMNAAGCTAEDKVWVRVSTEAERLYLPNTFSPNNDGVNDVFYPRSKSALRVVRFRILNRTGVAVYEKRNFYTNDPATGWDGRYQGIVRSDAYVYAIEVINTTGESIYLTGNVSIIQ